MCLEMYSEFFYRNNFCLEININCLEMIYFCLVKIDGRRSWSNSSSLSRGKRTVGGDLISHSFGLTSSECIHSRIISVAHKVFNHV
jgi:hypothetical protein